MPYFQVKCSKKRTMSGQFANSCLDPKGFKLEAILFK